MKYRIVLSILVVAIVALLFMSQQDTSTGPAKNVKHGTTMQSKDLDAMKSLKLN